MRNGLTRGIQALWFRLNDEAWENESVLLEARNGLEVGIAEYDRWLVASLGEAPNDLVDFARVDSNELAHAGDHGAQRVGGWGEQLDGVSGDVFGDDLALPVENRSSRRRDGNWPKPVGFGLELELLVLKDLGPKEGTGEDQEREEKDPLRRVGALPQAVGIEAVHTSSRTENHCLDARSTSSANAAVARASSGL